MVLQHCYKWHQSLLGTHWQVKRTFLAERLGQLVVLFRHWRVAARLLLLYQAHLGEIAQQEDAVLLHVAALAVRQRLHGVALQRRPPRLGLERRRTRVQ